MSGARYFYVTRMEKGGTGAFFSYQEAGRFPPLRSGQRQPGQATTARTKERAVLAPFPPFSYEVTLSKLRPVRLRILRSRRCRGSRIDIGNSTLLPLENVDQAKGVLTGVIKLHSALNCLEGVT